MDTVFSPYNSMFSVDFTKEYSATTYLVKIDGAPVHITHNLYWKKDFLEESLCNFSRYKENNDLLYMDDYLNVRVSDLRKRSFLSKRLIPGKADVAAWLPWYIRFAGYGVAPGASIEVWKFKFLFENNKAIAKDSSCIYKTIFINAQ